MRRIRSYFYADVEVSKVASVTDIYQVELTLVVIVSCFSRPSVLWYEQNT